MRHQLASSSSMDMDDTGTGPHLHLPHQHQHPQQQTAHHGISRPPFAGGALPTLPPSPSGGWPSPSLSSGSTASSSAPSWALMGRETEEQHFSSPDAEHEEMVCKAKEAAGPYSPSSSPCHSPYLEAGMASYTTRAPIHPQHAHQMSPALGSSRSQMQPATKASSRETDLEECRALFNQLQYNLARQFEFLQHERGGIAKERAVIEQKRQAFEEVKKTMTNVLQLQESRVRLNVGGCKFTTSLDTLLIYPESMLGSMFSGKFKLEKDEKGYFFIDRDGTHFRYILNFLRSGTLLMPEDPVVKRELLVEAEFYQIRPLIDLILHGPQSEMKFSHALVHKNITLDSTRTIATVATKGTCRLLLDTHSISTGKSYWEFHLDKLQNPNCIAIGVTRTTGNLSAYVGGSKDGWSLIVMNRENMKKWNSPTCEEYGKGVFKEGDSVGVLLDYTSGDRGTLSFYLNGVCQGEAFRNLPPHLFPTVSLHSKGDQVSLLPSRLPEDA